MDITEKAGKYAEGKANEAMTNAIAQAYADGYRDGYKDREEEIPVDLRMNQTTFIDMGLPSGTLWSSNYEKDGDNIIFLPYDKAVALNIPTIEQWNELFSLCKWESARYNNSMMRVDCTGPNGRVVSFLMTGMIKALQKSDHNEAFFWLKEDIEGSNKKAVHIYRSKANYQGHLIYINHEYSITTENTFSGFKLPLRLVSTKKTV